MFWSHIACATRRAAFGHAGAKSQSKYVATLPWERWTRRILEWNIRSPWERGRPPHTLETALQKRIAEVAAYDHWMRTLFNFRRMIRCVVSAPDRICWGDPWHEIVHIWIQRVREVVGACHTKTWAGTCASEHGKYACHTMNFPHERWVRRMLHWAKRASIRMATACEKGGQETKHMGHKN